MATVTWPAASAPSSAARRSRSSSRARRVNVTARQRSGGRPAPIRCAIACVSTRVLPAPGPATTSSGPPSWVTIACCSGSRPAGPAAAGRRRGQPPPRRRPPPRSPPPASRPAPRLAPGPARARRPGQVEQRRAGQLVRVEQPDRPVHAVVPGLAAHLAAAQPGDRLRDDRRRARRQVVERHVAEDGQFRPEPLDHGADLGGDGLGLRADARDLAEDLRQRHERRETRGAVRPVPVRPVGERVDPVLHADRRLLPASRALAAGRAGLLRRHPDVAGAVAVEVVLALLGEELDGAAEAVAGAQRPVDGEVVDVGQLERRRLPAEHGRRVRVGVGHQPVPVEAGHPPVHRGVGGQARSRWRQMWSARSA